MKSDSLKIGFVTTLPGGKWGGSEELWSQSAQRVLDHHGQVSVNTFKTGSRHPVIATLRSAGARVHTRNSPRWIPWRLHAAYARVQAKSWLQREALDLVLLSEGGAFTNMPWMDACRRANVPFINLVQAANEAWWPDDSAANHIRSAYKLAVCHCFVSNANRRLVQAQVAMLLPNARVVRNPFNVGYSARMSWPRPNGEFSLACVGRLSPSAKGQDLLLEVLAAPEWKSRNVKLALYGSGLNQDNISDLVRMHSLTNIEIKPHTPDVEGIWARHQALVLPSRFEGLPLVIVEAMLCGRVCIVTDVGGNAELIEDGITGFVATAPTATALAEAMERAWQMRENWEVIGREAAVSVRRFVPADPAAEFAAFLTETCRECLRERQASERGLSQKNAGAG